jgi:hypothetical protein
MKNEGRKKMSKIQPEEYYLEKLKEVTEPKILLARANLKLLDAREKKLDDQMEEIQVSKAEWLSEKEEAEANLTNPGPAMKRMLERDFYAEVSQRKQGGDPVMRERTGSAQFGIKIQSQNRRKVMIPQLKRDGDREFYQNWETEIEDRRDNEQAYSEWLIYMEKGLLIQKDWDFKKTFKEIEKFFNNAPSLDRYGPVRTVYAETGLEYRKAGE